MDDNLKPAFGLSGHMADWGRSCSLDSVPHEVVAVAKRCVIDFVGVTLAAGIHPATRQVRDYAKRTYAAGPAVALPFGDLLNPVAAALVNGMAAHVLDFDDTSYTGIMHGSTVALPAALAASAHAGANGRRFLEAVIVGSEIAYAVALLCTTRHYFKGWWSTATFGVFGAAAAAAKAMDLSVKETISALSLAGIQSSGLKVAFGTDAKPYMAGRAAAVGVETALLAREGLCGPPGILESRNGFLQLLNDGHYDPAGIDALGRIWRLSDPGIFFKQYPVCSGAHAAVELTQRLLCEYRVRNVDVLKVLCEVPPTVAISLVYDQPKTIQEAQFSMPFAVGVMLARGALDIHCLTDETLSDPHVQSAMARVEMRRVDSLDDQTSPECARVTVFTTAGAKFSGLLQEPTGMPRNPMTDEQLHEKFIKCAAAGGLVRKDASALLNHLAHIERAPPGLRFLERH